MRFVISSLFYGALFMLFVAVDGIANIQEEIGGWPIWFILASIVFIGCYVKGACYSDE